MASREILGSVDRLVRARRLLEVKIAGERRLTMLDFARRLAGEEVEFGLPKESKV